MKYKLISLYIFLFGVSLLSRDFNYKECIDSAVSNNPSNRQSNFYKTISMLENQNSNSIYYPQIKLEASANYQSDVFEFPIKIPTITVPSVDKFQYQFSLNLYQNIYEGGLSSNSKDLSKAELMANLKNVEISNIKVTEIVSEIYFSILKVQESIRSLSILAKTLDERKNQVAKLVNSGVVLKKDFLVFDLEVMKVNQKIEELSYDGQILIKMLAVWTGIDFQKYGKEIKFILPLESDEKIDKIVRPELDYLLLKQESISKKKNVIESQVMPQISAFGKLGYGNPNPFNMFDNTLSMFYFAGLKLQWNIFDWDANYNSRKMLDNQSEILKTEYENTERNFELQIKKNSDEIEKYKSMIKKDGDIINTQKEIVASVYSQFTNGTATSTDYVTEQNSLTSFEINLDLHKIMQLQSIYNNLIKSGNFK